MTGLKAAYFDSQVDSAWASKEYTQEELAKISRMLGLANWKPDMSILEPGCGTGRLTEVLAKLAEGRGYILATDISQKMVQAAVERLGERKNVSVECTAVEALPVTAGQFDLVICHQVFPHFDDTRRALEFLAGCLKPFGRLVVLHFINSTQINDRHRKTDPSVVDDSMPTEEEMRSLFYATGFKIEVLEDDDRGYLLVAVR